MVFPVAVLGLDPANELLKNAITAKDDEKLEAPVFMYDSKLFSCSCSDKLQTDYQM